MDSYPRVLIMDHNAFHEKKNNGKTKSALFSGYPKDKLAQFYIFNESPSYTVCGNFFRMTDYDILRANVRFKTASGRVLTEWDDIKPEHLYVTNQDDLKGLHRILYKAMENRLPSIELAREVAWRKSIWQASDLIQWLDEYNPQVIFTLGSNCVFFHKIIHWIKQRYNTKLFLYSTDDYTFVRSVVSPIAWINHFRYMYWFKKSIAKAEKFYAISPAMKKEYVNRFKILNAGLLTNSISECELTPEPVQGGNYIRLIYAGGMHYNRWKVLSWLGDCLEQLQKEGCYGILDIYCPSLPSRKIIEALTKFSCVNYKGSLNSEALRNEINKSNVLVHVEAFDRASIKKTRLSLSTKIPEYMMSNRCILAIGPNKVASMQYLKENNAALCINSLKDMKDIQHHLFDSKFRGVMGKSARKIAMQNHSLLKMQQELFNDLILG